MIRNSVQPRDRIFVKGYEFLSFAKNIYKNIGKNISKNLSGKYSQKLLNHAKQSAKDTFKTALIKAIQKAPEATSDLIGNKITKTVTGFSKNSQQYNSETVTNEHDEEIPKERYIPPEERQKTINDLR